MNWKFVIKFPNDIWQFDGQNAKMWGGPPSFFQTLANFIFQFMPNDFQPGQFILLINKLFDIFNSRLEVNKSNPAFTGSLDQILILNDALFAIKNIKIPRINKNNETVFRNAFMHFQIGIIQSINAWLKLHTYLLEEFQIRYLLTYKIAQDCLENFFPQIRSLGQSYSNPTPAEYIYRFRILIFTKKFPNIRFSKNIEPDKIEEPLLTFEIGQIN